MASIVRSDLSSLGGSSVEETFSFGKNGPGMLYGSDEQGMFFILHQEKGVAYGETSETELTTRWSSKLSGPTGVSYKLSTAPVEMWGINFAGTLQVEHSDGSKGVIYVPGVRSYDPTGRTGDPHASERIGPSCAKFQTAVTVAELAAVANGANEDQLREIQDQFSPSLKQYHGRVGLFKWMKRQIEEVVLKKQSTVTPFPEFIKEMAKAGEIDLPADNQEHTRVYLESYDKGQPVAPPHYFRKVQAKDKVEDVVKSSNLQRFKSLSES